MTRKITTLFAAAALIITFAFSVIPTLAHGGHGGKKHITKKKKAKKQQTKKRASVARQADGHSHKH